MVRTRVLVGSSLLVGFLLVAWLDGYADGGPVFHILIGALMVVTLLEVYGLAERQGNEPLKIVPLVLVVCLVAGDYAARVLLVATSGPLVAHSASGPLAPTLAPIAGNGLPLPRNTAALWNFYAPMGIAAVASLTVLATAQLPARSPQQWLASAPVTALGFLYVWFFGAHLFAIRGFGMGYVLAFLGVAKLGDAGAYFVGSRWGRFRLAPLTSPKKTVEGAIAGLAASTLSAVAIARIFRLESGIGFWALFGAVVGLASQVGDMVESALKRSAGAKDSGQLLPTFGGILDVVDSPLFSAPVAFWLLVV
jgi:phosphatidate cytidylyltransferase